MSNSAQAIAGSVFLVWERDRAIQQNIYYYSQVMLTLSKVISPPTPTPSNKEQEKQPSCELLCPSHLIWLQVIPPNTHRHIHVCVQCKTTRNLHQHQQGQLDTNTIKYQGRGYSMKRGESEQLAELRERLIFTQTGLFVMHWPLTSLTCLNKEKGRKRKRIVSGSKGVTGRRHLPHSCGVSSPAPHPPSPAEPTLSQYHRAPSRSAPPECDKTSPLPSPDRTQKSSATVKHR